MYYTIEIFYYETLYLKYIIDKVTIIIIFGYMYILLYLTEKIYIKK